MLTLPAFPLAGEKTEKGNWMGLSVLGMELFKINKPEPTSPTHLWSRPSLKKVDIPTVSYAGKWLVQGKEVEEEGDFKWGTGDSSLLQTAGSKAVLAL